MQVDIRDDSPAYVPKLITIRLDDQYEHEELAEGLKILSNFPNNQVTLEIFEAIKEALRRTHLGD